MARLFRSFVAVALAGLGVASTTQAAHGEVRQLTTHLDWTAPDTTNCPSGPSMLRAVEARLGRPVFVERQQADVFLTVAVRPNGATWSANLELRDSKDVLLGTRRVESKSRDCAALNDVLPIVIALLVDASQRFVRLELPAPKYQPPIARTEIEPTPENATVPPSPPVSQQQTLHWGWLALAEAVHGLMPTMAPGANLVGFVEPGRPSVAFEIWLGAIPPTANDQTVGLRLSLVHAGVRLCPSLQRGSLRWAICAGVGVGSLQAVGRGFDVNRGETVLLADVRATGQLDVLIFRPWFARIEVGAIVPMSRPRFEGEAEPLVRTTLHRPAIFEPRIAVGMGVGFR